MSYAETWTSADAIAQCLRTSPQTTGLIRVFDRDGLQADLDPGERALSNLDATLGLIGTRPLLVGLYAPQLPPLPDAMPGSGYDELLRIPEFRTLMDDAHLVAETLLFVIEKIRAHLPGYPNLLMPALMPQAPAVEMDGMLGTGMPWPAAFRQPEVQVDTLLQPALADVASDDLERHIHELGAAIRNTDEWLAFTDAATDLSDEARAELQGACDEFEKRTAPEVLDEQAGGRLMSRAQYTRALLDEISAGLSPDASKYAQTFAHIDRLISEAGTVISDRAVHATPVIVPGDAEVRWQRDAGRVVVNARFSGDPFLKPGRLLVHDGQAPTRGAWLVTATTMNIGFGSGGLSVGLDAIVLPESEVLLESPGGADDPGER